MDAAAWAAGSSSVWEVLWALLGDEGANLLGGSSWILLGFEWVFSVLPFPSLPAALRLLHPEEAFSAALPRRFLRKSMNNTKGEKKPFANEFEEYKEKQSCLEMICSRY